MRGAAILQFPNVWMDCVPAYMLASGDFFTSVDQ